MKQAQVGTGPKIVLFSAHDTTILSIAMAFKLISIECLMEAYFNPCVLYYSLFHEPLPCVLEYPVNFKNK
jgi:hypothetical protein